MAKHISEGVRRVHRDMTLKIGDLSRDQLIEALERLVGDNLRRRKGDIKAALTIGGRPLSRVSETKLRVTLAELENRLWRSGTAKGGSNFGQLLPVHR